jgi:hypothetical protein
MRLRTLATRARGLVVRMRLLQSRDRRFDSDRAHGFRLESSAQQEPGQPPEDGRDDCGRPRRKAETEAQRD